MKLLLIRHADPDYVNHTITPKGHRQAELLAESLVSVKIDHLIVSPLGRAQHTAAYIIERTGLAFETIDFFQELRGNYRNNDYAWEYRDNALFSSDIDISNANWPQHVPYGEHMVPVYDELTQKFDAFLSRYSLEPAGNLYKVNRASDETVAIVCHGGVIDTLLSHLLHIPLPFVYAQFRIDPSSVTRLTLHTQAGMGFFRLNTLNDMSHTNSMPKDTAYRTMES